MPESGDVEVLAPARIHHLPSRRRFDLKLDLPSALSGAGRPQRGDKKPRLDLLSAPAILTSRLAADPGNNHPAAAPLEQGDRPLSADSCLGQQTTACLGQQTTCLGQQTGCLSQQTACLGQQTTCLGHQTTCLGHQTTCSGQQTACLGQQTGCLSHQTTCLGQQTACLGQQTTCLGHQTICLGQQTACLGQQTACLGHHQTTTCPFRTSKREEKEEEEEERTVVGGGGGGPAPPSLSPPPPFRPITSGELAAKLRRSSCRSPLVIDCRPGLRYHARHVQGALNVSGADRLNRRRLQQGKVGVLDLLAAAHGKDSFRRQAGASREVVLYDERGGLGGGSGSSSGGLNVPDAGDSSGSSSALNVVLATLTREGRQPAVLQGGMKQFEAEYPELCWSSRRQLEVVPSRLLCSPTNDTMEPEIETATASRVLPFLFLGNERDAAELERLRRHNITYVLNVTAHVPHYWHAHGIRYKRIPASDSAQQNLKQYFEEAIEYIDDARRSGASVLIHCHAGVSRSATITIAYLLKHSRLPMGDAYKLVKAKRGIISPNFNFLGQLLEFEQELDAGLSPRVLSPALLGPSEGV